MWRLLFNRPRNSPKTFSTTHSLLVMKYCIHSGALPHQMLSFPSPHNIVSELTQSTQIRKFPADVPLMSFSFRNQANYYGCKDGPSFDNDQQNYTCTFALVSVIFSFAYIQNLICKHMSPANFIIFHLPKYTLPFRLECAAWSIRLRSKSSSLNKLMNQSQVTDVRFFSGYS